MQKILASVGLFVVLFAMASCNREPQVPKCEKPTFSVGEYDRISIGSQTYEATIYYEVMRGGGEPYDPHSGSRVFEHFLYTRFPGKPTPIVIKAQAVLEGYENSDIATETFYIDANATDPDTEFMLDKTNQTLSWRLRAQEVEPYMI